MKVVPFFSIAILVATIASIVLAIGSYAAYRLRERRKPNRNFPERETQDLAFFRRYHPESRHSGAVEGTGAGPAIESDEEERRAS
jgi:hypothetical protein